MHPNAIKDKIEILIDALNGVYINPVDIFNGMPDLQKLGVTERKYFIKEKG